MKKKAMWQALFALYCAVMLWLLFDRSGGIEGAEYWEQVRQNLNLEPFRTIRLFLRLLDSDTYRRTAIINLFGNIGMFIPLGFFLPLLWEGLRKWWRTWLATMGIMTAVEILQLFSLRGSCDVDDLILNLLGAAVGYGLFWILNAKNKIRRGGEP